MQISDRDMVRSHRVGRRAEDRSTPRDIIVRFTTHNTKSSVMRSARKQKGTHVSINEDLTKTRATIAWEARTLKRERKISDTWTRDGVIFVKKGRLEYNLSPPRERGKLLVREKSCQNTWNHVFFTYIKFFGRFYMISTC